MYKTVKSKVIYFILAFLFSCGLAAAAYFWGVKDALDSATCIKDAALTGGLSIGTLIFGFILIIKESE